MSHFEQPDDARQDLTAALKQWAAPRIIGGKLSETEKSPYTQEQTVFDQGPS